MNLVHNLDNNQITQTQPVKREVRGVRRNAITRQRELLLTGQSQRQVGRSPCVPACDIVDHRGALNGTRAGQ